MLFGILSAFLHTEFWTTSSKGVEALYYAARINLFLAMFNMVPIPPLDGSKVLQYFLHGEARARYLMLEAKGMFLLFGLLILDRGILHLGIFETFYDLTVSPLEHAFMSAVNLDNFFRLG